MSPHAQLKRLLDLGVADLANVESDHLSDLVSELSWSTGAVLAVHPSLVPASRLAPLLRRAGKAGFVVCIGSRRPKPKGYDARTPALWISGGTGHDGPERRDAPKVGWCWWRNRHTWLGFASAAERR